MSLRLLLKSVRFFFRTENPNSVTTEADLNTRSTCTGIGTEGNGSEDYPKTNISIL